MQKTGYCGKRFERLEFQPLFSKKGLTLSLRYALCCFRGEVEDMKTVNEVHKTTGVSVRTLRYYDRIGLLKPSAISAAGYRLYDDAALEKLQLILLYRELQFPLKEIKRILSSADCDRTRILAQQVELLKKKKAHLENLITFARGIQMLGVKNLDFSVFDTRKLDEYAARAQENWGKTEAWQEFEEKQKHKTREDNLRDGADMMQIFAEFGAIAGKDPSGEEAQALVEELRTFITKHFYNCTVQILSGLGKMYAGGGEFTENIDRAGGEGTAAFAGKAIEIYCERNQ